MQKYRNIRKTNLKKNIYNIDLDLEIDQLATEVEKAVISSYHNNSRLQESFGKVDFIGRNKRVSIP